MSDKLVVYYSRTGSTRAAASKLAEYLDCDLSEIVSRKNFSGPFGYLAGNKTAKKELPVEITEPDLRPENYKTVIVCSPVWASNTASPVRAYLNSNKGKFKRVSYLLTFRGKGQDKALEKMETIGGKPVKTVTFSGFERKSDVWSEKLTAYANEL